MKKWCGMFTFVSLENKRLSSGLSEASEWAADSLQEECCNSLVQTEQMNRWEFGGWDGTSCSKFQKQQRRQQKILFLWSNHCMVMDMVKWQRLNWLLIVELVSSWVSKRMNRPLIFVHLTLFSLSFTHRNTQNSYFSLTLQVFTGQYLVLWKI